MKRTDQAMKDLKNGFNCAQAVSAAFCEEFGVKKEHCAKMACALGAGMSRSAGVCGAVSGALMVIGLKYGSSKPEDVTSKLKSYEIGKEFLEKFNARYTSIMCPKLINIDISSENGMQEAKNKGVFETICTNIVKVVITILEEMGFGEN